MTRDDAAKKILVLTPQFPSYPPHQGTIMRNYHLIAGLATRHEVHLLSFGHPAEMQGAPMADLCQSVHIVPTPQRTMAQRLRGVFFSRLPDMAQRLPSAAFQEALAATLAGEHPDVVEVEGIELAQYLVQVAESRAGTGRPLLIFDDHNAEYVLQQRAFETDIRHPGRWVAAAYSFIQWQRLKSYERRACRMADRVVAVSDTDAQALRKLVPGLEPVVVPNGVDMAYYTAPIPSLEALDRPGPRDLVFTAKMDFRPNVDAVLWFAEETLPLIRDESPETRFWVVGKDPHPRLAHLAEDPGIRMTGWVEDVRPYIAGSGLYVIPLRIGGGTRLKVLEAMAMGKAIVSTALGCEGFDVRPDQELVIADTPAEFAMTVLALLRDPEHRERLGRAARRFAGSSYDWTMIVPQLEQVYQS
jgi:sugar transferase (PEP-CTERM/EpsH1 system associated)